MRTEPVHPTHPAEFYSRAVERIETLTAALKAHPGPATNANALYAAQTIGNAAYALEKALNWLDKPTEED